MTTTPEQVGGTVEMVSVTWLLNNIRSSVDGLNTINEYGDEEIDFGMLLRGKATDTSFEALVKTIVERGFRVPICLYGQVNGWHQGNGHHRLAAAILLCLDAIPVYWATDGDYMSTEHTNTEDFRWNDHGDFEGIIGLCDFSDYLNPYDY